MTCDFCGSSSIAEVFYSQEFPGSAGGIVQGLKKMECPDCGVEYVDQEQANFNCALVDTNRR